MDIREANLIGNANNSIFEIPFFLLWQLCHDFFFKIETQAHEELIFHLVSKMYKIFLEVACHPLCLDPKSHLKKR